MWWMALAAAGQSIMKLGVQANLNDAQKAGIEANTYAQKQTQKGNAIVAAGQTQLTTFMQSLGNQRILRASGEQVNAGRENLGRMLDGAVSSDFSRSIAASEALGSVAAASAAAGVGGAAVDTIASTMRRANAVQGSAIDRNVDVAAYDAMTQIAGASAAGVASLDSSYNVAPISYAAPNQPFQLGSPNYLGEFLNFAGKYGKDIGQALGDWLGKGQSSGTESFSMNVMPSIGGSSNSFSFSSPSLSSAQYKFTI